MDFPLLTDANVVVLIVEKHASGFCLKLASKQRHRVVSAEGSVCARTISAEFLDSFLTYVLSRKKRILRKHISSSSRKEKLPSYLAFIHTRVYIKSKHFKAQNSQFISLGILTINF